MTNTEQVTQADLPPCPFCGGEATITPMLPKGAQLRVAHEPGCIIEQMAGTTTNKPVSELRAAWSKRTPCEPSAGTGAAVTGRRSSNSETREAPNATVSASSKSEQIAPPRFTQPPSGSTP